MIHNATEDGGHYAANVAANGDGILVQLGANGDDAWRQVRNILTPGEAVHFANLILSKVEDLTGKPTTEIE